MAWEDTLLDASFRGVKFDVQNVDRSGSRSIAQNEYPYAAGAELDDMNLKARRFRFKIIIWGDDYEDRLQQLIDALETPGAGELVHPVYGGILAMAESWDDQHEAELVDGVTLSINFIEQSVRELVFAANTASSKTDAISAKGEDARAAADDALVRRMEKAKDGSERRLAVLQDTFD
jgi:prophage DNA circulation protein